MRDAVEERERVEEKIMRWIVANVKDMLGFAFISHLNTHYYPNKIAELISQWVGLVLG